MTASPIMLGHLRALSELLEADLAPESRARVQARYDEAKEACRGSGVSEDDRG